MITSKNYKRATADMDKFSAAKVFKSGAMEQNHTVTAVAPATGSVLPSGQYYTTPDEYQESIICGGTVKLIGNIFGWLVADTKVGDKAAWVIDGAIVMVKTAGTFALGGKVYIGNTDGLGYTASGAGKSLIGFACGDSEGTIQVTSPDNMPTGDYVFVKLNQIPS